MKNTINASIIAIVLSTTPVLAEVATHGDYKIDPAHSTIQFTVSHLGTSHLTGRFNVVAGNIIVNSDGASSTEVTIQANSVYTNHKKRDAHLRSPDFFNVKQYPVIRFISNSIEYNSRREPISIVGKLSMHGKTKTVRLKVKPVGAGKDPWGGYRVGYDATTTIKRSDFGMNFMSGGIGDDINITLNIEAFKI